MQGVAALRTDWVAAFSPLDLPRLTAVEAGVSDQIFWSSMARWHMGLWRLPVSDVPAKFHALRF
jgi:hypothetical protein